MAKYNLKNERSTRTVYAEDGYSLTYNFTVYWNYILRLKYHLLCIRYMLKLLAPIYLKVGFTSKPEDNHLDILLRKKVVSYNNYLTITTVDCTDVHSVLLKLSAE